MEILNIGVWELVIFLIISFLLLGPKGMILTAYKIGKWIRETVRSPMWREILHYAQEIRELPKKLMDETGLEAELKEVQKTTNEAMKEVDQSLKEVAQAARVPEAEHLRLHTGETTVPSASKPGGGQQFVPLATFPSLTESGEVKKLTPEELQAAAAAQAAGQETSEKVEEGELALADQEAASPEQPVAQETLAAEVAAAQDVPSQDQPVVIGSPAAPEAPAVQEVPAASSAVFAQVSEDAKVTTPDAAPSAVPDKHAVRRESIRKRAESQVPKDASTAQDEELDRPMTAAEKLAARREAVRKRVESKEPPAAPKNPAKVTVEDRPTPVEQQIAAQEAPEAQEAPVEQEVPTAMETPAVIDVAEQVVDLDFRPVVEEVGLVEEPPVRKRGRKKKGAQVFESAPEAEPVGTPADLPVPELQAPAAQEEIMSQAAPAPKRGRPRKNPLPADAVVPPTVVENALLPARKRGRPRKNSVAADAAVAPAVVDTALSLARKRGRPRKNPTPADAAVQPAVVETTLPAVQENEPVVVAAPQNGESSAVDAGMIAAPVQPVHAVENTNGSAKPSARPAMLDVAATTDSDLHVETETAAPQPQPSPQPTVEDKPARRPRKPRATQE